MNSPDYAFLDCGGGRRLERFGEAVVDRPAPVAAWAPGLSAEAWDAARLRFRPGAAGGGFWSGQAPDDWRIGLPPFREDDSREDVDSSAAPRPTPRPTLRLALQLAPGAGGQVGAFPEQWPVAARMARALARRSGGPPGAAPELLTLFAHTGAATLMALAAGARATHVDASAGALSRAKANARVSGLDKAPVRWIMDDALEYAAREVRRGRTYEAILIDPPAFGRAPRGRGARGWKLERDLPELLRLAGRLMAPDFVFFGLCWHAPEEASGRVAAMLEEAFGEWRLPGEPVMTRLELASRVGGNALPAGRSIVYMGN